MARDLRVEDALREAGVEPRRTPGNFIADIGKLRPYSVFTPFWRAWEELPRRESMARRARSRCPRICASMRSRPAPGGVDPSSPPARRAGRKRMLAWTTRITKHDRLDRDTSLLSPYLHFGCISARELEERTGGAYARQLAWRDFYAHVLLHNPDNVRHAFRRELDRSNGPAPTSTSTPGARAAPATRSSTPGCGNWRRPAGCITARD